MTDRLFGDTAAILEGGGPPVILIHGMGLNRHMWEWQLPPLLQRFRVIRYDLLGHGESNKTIRNYQMDDLVDQIVRLMDALKLDRCALVGFSLGGMIGQAFAIAHPDRISALAILNSAHDRSEEQRTGMLERLETAIQSGLQETTEVALARWFNDDFAARRPDVIDKVRQWMMANDPKVYPLLYRILAEGDRPLATAINEIRCPTLALACEQDHGNSPAMAHRMAELIPKGRAVVVPGLKHMGLAENPDAISRILVPFLEETL
ncbi:MAG: alpha/beta fold hydrolase [Alphaproteobacteria bacterium]|nr:alpha/beta fold hydrolase [Alphaproteobacteria bacterium]